MLQLKDLEDLELTREIDNYTVKFELESMLYTKSKFLSGGMKRKLSVAISLIGKSKVKSYLTIVSDGWVEIVVVNAIPVIVSTVWCRP